MSSAAAAAAAIEMEDDDDDFEDDLGMEGAFAMNLMRDEYDEELLEDSKMPALPYPPPRRNLSKGEASRRRMSLNALDKPNAASLWRELPREFKADKEFVLKAVTTFETLPPKCEFERLFPQSLRFDKDVVLAFCARSDFEDLYYERLLHVPHCLTSDKQVMMAYCQKIPRSLQEASEDLTRDRQVVLAAVGRCGLELQYAALELRQDKEIVVAACQSNGRALEFCPRGCPVQQELTSDRDFMLQVLRKHGGPMLRLVNDELKQDRELLLEALKHGMRLRFCPLEFQNDRAFLLEALEKQAELYLEMNRNVQADRELAHAAICSSSSTPAVIVRGLEHVPALKRERPIVHAICQRGDPEFILNFLEQEADDIFKDDKNIMLTALSRDPKIFSLASPRLQRDVDVVLAALSAETASDVLNSVGSAVQEAHPQITIQAITVASTRCLRLLRPLIPEALWTSNRDVAIAWIRRSGRVLDVFESLLATDEEMAMEVAEHAHHDFGRVGETLRSNVAFMTRAVDKNGRVLRYATREIRTNLDLCVRAMASHADALGATTAEGTALFGMDRNAVKAHVQAKLDLHQTFVRDFLRGIAIANPPHVPPSRRSQLPMLDRGVETSEAFKQLIAEFLGVPVGADLRIMRTAMRNLEQPPSLEGNLRRSAAAMMEMDEEMARAGAAAAGLGDHHADRWARRRLLRRRMLEMRGDMPGDARPGGGGENGGGAMAVIRLGFGGGPDDDDMDDMDRFMARPRPMMMPPIPPRPMAPRPAAGARDPPAAAAARLGFGGGPDGDDMDRFMARPRAMMPPIPPRPMAPRPAAGARAPPAAGAAPRAAAAGAAAQPAAAAARVDAVEAEVGFLAARMRGVRESLRRNFGGGGPQEQQDNAPAAAAAAAPARGNERRPVEAAAAANNAARMRREAEIARMPRPFEPRAPRIVFGFAEGQGPDEQAVEDLRAGLNANRPEGAPGIQVHVRPARAAPRAGRARPGRFGARPMGLDDDDDDIDSDMEEEEEMFALMMDARMHGDDWDGPLI